MLIGSVQANPMSRETTANNERIAQLTIAKRKENAPKSNRS